MMNGSMAAIPAALSGSLGLSLQGAHQNINHQLSQLSAFGISGGRSRMPDAHVEMLLDCYKAVQEERTLDSGRLGKGAFHQITEQLNKRTAGNYCKDQVTAKLQNLKAQFRQRRAAVEAGHGEMRDWKWYDRMHEIMSDGTTETYTDFDGKSRGSNSRSPTPASAQALNGSFNASYGMAGNLSKIIQSLPPQIRDNPAALAQLMHSNPLFGLQAAGLHAQAAAVSSVGAAHASATNSPLGNLFKLDEQLEEEKQKLNEAIREQSKPHALNLLQQQQNAALQRSLMARVQATHSMNRSIPQSRQSPSPKKERSSPDLKRSAPFPNTDGHHSSPEVPDFKKARLGAGLSTPFAPPSVQPMESSLANLAVFMQSGNQNPKKECLTSLRNLAFQLFTGLSTMLSQIDQSQGSVQPTSNTESSSASPKPSQTQPNDQEEIQIAEISIDNTSKDEAQINDETEKQNESENSKVSELDEE